MKFYNPRLEHHQEIGHLLKALRIMVIKERDLERPLATLKHLLEEDFLSINVSLPDHIALKVYCGGEQPSIDYVEKTRAGISPQELFDEIDVKILNTFPYSFVRTHKALNAARDAFEAKKELLA